MIKLLAAVATAVAISVAAVSEAAVAQDSVVVPGDILVENCPVGFQFSRGIMVNATTQEVFTVCNSPLNEADLLLRQQDQDFMDAIRAAQQVAEDQSRAWNEAHPGQQRCVQWGPIVHANGVSTSSGGVCANPVAAPAQPSADVRTDSAPSVDVRPDPAPSVDVRINAPAPEPRPTPAPAPVAPPAPSGPSGIGGWAMVNDANQNLGTTVCDVSVCGTPGSDFLNAYHRDHPEIRFVYFAPAESSGNVAGWSGGTYDPGSNTFWLNGCSHVGGAPVSQVTCPPPPPAPTTSTSPSADSRTIEVRVPSDSSVQVRTESPNSVAPAQPSTQPQSVYTPHGNGAWAEVTDANVLVNGVVCEPAVCGDPNSDFNVVYRRDHPGVRFVYFAPAEPSGNVAGWGSGTYDPATNTFWNNGCSHYGGAPLSEITCPVVIVPSPTSADVRTTDTRAPVVATADSRAPVTSSPSSASQQDSQSGVTTVAGSAPAPTGPLPNLEPLPVPLPSPVETTSARPDVTTTIVLGEVTQAQQTNVAIASLIKSAVALPTATTSGSVKLAVSNVKITSKSLTPKVCSVTSKGVKQLGYGRCKVELSVTLADGSKVSTTKVIAFRKKA
ncbi:MAG: hypothetical protein KGL72_06335 [Actinomycetales bacterium]|nr:hypothetical protein [Actinomycetales bacterium]